MRSRKKVPSAKVFGMCGVAGFASWSGSSRDHDRDEGNRTVRSMLAAIAHRGPDDLRVECFGALALGHARLAILDPERGVQPVRARCPNGSDVVVAFNGEIYNHLEVRRELIALGAQFQTHGDAETLAFAFSAWGAEALPRLRGMFAIAAWFPESDELILARDPLGIVPMHWTIARDSYGPVLVFASEIPAILKHSAVRKAPDLAAVGAYLRMPRRSFGERTLYEGIRSLRPGHLLHAQLRADSRDVQLLAFHEFASTAPDSLTTLADAAAAVREAVIESIVKHLQSDVPVASLLSGGVDSTIIAAIARAHGCGASTFAAGAEGDEISSATDLTHARHVARRLRSEHHECIVRRGEFLRRWQSSVQRLGLPLATPNEIAISALAESIRPHAKVALSGEGADELFGGYEPAIAAIQGFLEHAQHHGHRPSAQDAAAFHLDAFSWAPTAAVPELLAPKARLAARLEPLLEQELALRFEQAGDPSLLETHLAVQQEFNLLNLLERLNSNLMLHSVEGRVPFSDVRVLEVARAIPASLLFQEHASGTTCTRTLVGKRVLKAAFADVLPPSIVARPKASFPLPFQEWMPDCTAVLEGDAARAMLSPAAIELVRNEPSRHWRLSWPMLNIAMWANSNF
ncbi:MAG: asparagine synthase (glutamine-hydrolyzing) [Phycisphaerales bacterium]|nr:asparagine synthase (glutamine-hydrolyzing) [Phycisphaerales bacterium]